MLHRFGRNAFALAALLVVALFGASSFALAAKTGPHYGSSGHGHGHGHKACCGKHVSGLDERWLRAKARCAGGSSGSTRL